MNATVTPALMQRPAALAVRVVANGRLDACTAAFEQMDAGAPEALHDLRVSLRRLRSWLRTFRPYIDDSVRKRSHRRLKRLVRATNGARDMEVWTEWLGEQRDLAPRDRTGVRYLQRALAAEGKAAHEKALDRIQRRVPRILDALRDDLSTYSLHVRGGPAVDHRMSSAVVDALRSGVRRLHRRMNRVESLADVEAIHATRIAAKKLRYLVETLESNEAAKVAEALSELQDLLGGVHDMQLLVDRLLEEIELAGGADIGRRARLKIGLSAAGRNGAPSRTTIGGLTEIAKRAQVRAENDFLRFVREWKAERRGAIEADVAGVAEMIEARPTPQ